MGNKICQSCGLSLNEERYFGTNGDGSKNKEYCSYCFQGGHFTDPNITVEEKIDKVANMGISKLGISKAEAVKQAKEIIPNLKRWQGKKSSIKKKIILLAFVIAMILGIGLNIFLEENVGTEGDNDNGFFMMIPIWIAIFIPTIIAKKKKEKFNKEEFDQKLDPQRIKIGIIIFFIAILLVLGGVAMLLASQNQQPQSMIIIAIIIFLILIATITRVLRKK